MAERADFGLLINKDIKLHRKYFIEMTKFLGFQCLYYAPRADKAWDIHGELSTNYYEPIKVGVIFQEHPDQKTLKKMGWVAELQESSSIIHVPYDLENLQVGALFEIPSAIDEAKGRLFRVISMQTIMIYPASIACEIAPEYESTEAKSQTQDFSKTTINVLLDNEEDD